MSPQLQASELREIGKLRQMVHTQEHLMRHTAGGSSESEREIARIRRVHNSKVVALQRRIAEVESVCVCVCVRARAQERALVAAARAEPRRHVALLVLYEYKSTITDAELLDPLQVERKNERLSQLLAQSRVDKIAQARS